MPEPFHLRADEVIEWAATSEFDLEPKSGPAY